ncbi:hypothetical protein BJ322DRAFT_278536 [Thelephora terrestris]|uniref:Uncharacterized protein n=1 Tax=Thelephora terrestris TaxID=56493 RepID=A0A9P6H7G6_9AGAM|nr:hypothetical protein BJ322DRAFT_278536 [Thelephora terrestris]
MAQGGTWCSTLHSPLASPSGTVTHPLYGARVHCTRSAGKPVRAMDVFHSGTTCPMFFPLQRLQIPSVVPILGRLWGAARTDTIVGVSTHGRASSESATSLVVLYVNLCAGAESRIVFVPVNAPGRAIFVGGDRCRLHLDDASREGTASNHHPFVLNSANFPVSLKIFRISHRRFWRVFPPQIPGLTTTIRTRDGANQPIGQVGRKARKVNRAEGGRQRTHGHPTTQIPSKAPQSTPTQESSPTHAKRLL